MTGVREPYRCPYCDQPCKNRADLNRHFLTHGVRGKQHAMKSLLRRRPSSRSENP